MESDKRKTATLTEGIDPDVYFKELTVDGEPVELWFNFCRFVNGRDARNPIEIIPDIKDVLKTDECIDKANSYAILMPKSTLSG